MRISDWSSDVCSSDLIALRPVRPREGDLWGRKLADVAWMLYASPALLEAIGGPLPRAEDLARHPLIGWEEGVAGIAAADWPGRAAPAAAFVSRTSRDRKHAV